MAKDGRVMGVDLGGHTFVVGVADLGGKIIAQQEFETRQDERDPRENLLAGLARMAKGHKIAAAFLAVPGTLKLEEGIIIFSPNIQEMNEFPLGPEASKRLDGVPVRLGNDATTAIFGEIKFGKCKGRDVITAAGCTMGTGIGGGLVIDRTPHVGWRNDGSGGEMHVETGITGPLRCGCGSASCVEANCRAAAINQRAVNIVTDGYKTTMKEALGIKDGRIRDEKTAKQGPRLIQECADKGDWWAQWIYEQVGIALGRGFESVTKLVHPEVIVLVGKIARASRYIVPPLRAQLRLMDPVPEVMQGELEDRAGLMGAVASAIQMARE